MREKNSQPADLERDCRLYSFVYRSRVCFLFVFILLCSFLLQPFDRVYANDEIAVEPAAHDDQKAETSAESVESDPDPETEMAAETEAAKEEAVDETEPAADENDTKEAADLKDTSAGDEPPVFDPAAETSKPAANESADSVAHADSDGEEGAVSDPETTDGTGAAESDETGDTETGEEETTGSDITESVQSTSSDTESEAIANDAEDEADADTNEISVTVNSDSVVQFNKESCVAVADGSYYCQSQATAEAGRADGLYSLPDKDGDLEIFMQKDGVLTQISHNTEDDASASFDAESNTIVWHQMVNDRYQIISYDLETGEETQLTKDPVNNMEPARSGRYTVWQHWDNNWEIMLYDGETKIQLTNSVEHDVAPSINNGLVMWHRLSSQNDSVIEIYNIASKEFTTIHDEDGGTVKNARMVIVYESESANGDIVTKGYDLITGEIISLSSAPLDLPDEIPPPDSTGETRALIQSKAGSKEDIEADTQAPPPPPGANPPVEPVLGANDLDLRATSTLETLAEQNEGGDIASSTLPGAAGLDMLSDAMTLDLSIQSVPDAEVIPAVVVPPFAGSETAATADSQPTTDGS